VSWISFTWTTPALLAGRKQMTWRDWDVSYARQFRPGLLVDAYDRSPRNGGRKVATIRLTAVERIPIGGLADGDYEAEGLAYLAEHPEAWPKRMFGRKFSPELVSRAAFDERRRTNEVGYCVRFELVSIGGDAVVEKDAPAVAARRPG